MFTRTHARERESNAHLLYKIALIAADIDEGGDDLCHKVTEQAMIAEEYEVDPDTLSTLHLINSVLKVRGCRDFRVDAAITHCIKAQKAQEKGYTKFLTN